MTDVKCIAVDKNRRLLFCYSEAEPASSLRFLILDVWGALLSLLILTLGTFVLATGAGAQQGPKKNPSSARFPWLS